MLLKRFLVVFFLAIAGMALYDLATADGNTILGSIDANLSFLVLIFAIFSLAVILGRKSFHG